MDPAHDHAAPVPSFDYFMLRLGRSPAEPDRLFGVIERLGSGEKRRFDSGEQLMGLVQGWLDHAAGPTTEEATP